MLQQLIRENPLGILTTAIRSSLCPLIQSSHVPFVLDVPETTDGIPSKGILRGHLAKQNPQAKALMEALAAAQNEHGHHIRELSEEVLVLFNGPYHHYVTPKFYVKTKPDSGKVVPTWNYSAVQAYGKIRIYCDSKSDETGTFLQRQVEDLSRHAETSIMGYTGGGEAIRMGRVGGARTLYRDSEEEHHRNRDPDRPSAGQVQDEPRNEPRG